MTDTLDMGAIYPAARGRLTPLVTDLDDGQLTTVVPGTPAWTVHSLLSHITALPTDVVAGRVEGAGTDPWTARQVLERRDRTKTELLAEWAESAPQLEPLVGPVPQLHRAAWDLLIHEHDLRGAVGIGAGEVFDPAAAAAFVEATLTRLGDKITQAGLPALQVSSSDRSWLLGEGTPVVSLEATQLELFRSLAGRRSGGQLRALAWTGDPTPYLPLWSLFGQLPDADVVEAGT